MFGGGPVATFGSSNIAVAIEPTSVVIAPNGTLFILQASGDIVSAQCLPCWAGHLCDASGFFVEPCPAGMWCAEATAAAMPCAPGTSASPLASSAESSCSMCALGSYHNGTRGALALKGSNGVRIESGTLTDDDWWPPSGGCNVTLSVRGGGGGGSYESIAGAGAVFTVAFWADGTAAIRINSGRGGRGSNSRMSGSGGAGTTIYLGEKLIAVAGGGGGAGIQYEFPQPETSDTFRCDNNHARVYKYGNNHGGSAGFPGGVAGNGSSMGAAVEGIWSEVLRGGRGATQEGGGVSRCSVKHHIGKVPGARVHDAVTWK